MKLKFVAATVLGVAALVQAQAHAQAQSTYPTRAVRLLVGYAPGGSTDVVARTLAEALSKRWGQSVVVDNRPGADSIIATELVAKSAPDGYTLLLANSANATHPSTQAKVPYDVTTDLSPVIIAATAKNMITTATPGINTLQDAINLAKAKPGTVSYGSGSPLHHLIGELFAQQAKVKLNHIPYKGAGPAITDTIAGHVKLNVGTVTSQEPFIKNGKLRALAVTADQRSSVFPQVPTLAEAGISNVSADYWIGIMAPAKTPPAVVAKLNADVNAALKDPEVTRRFTELGLDAVGGSADRLGKLLNVEIDRWAEVAKQAGIEKQ